MLQKIEGGHILPDTLSHNPKHLGLLWTPGNTDTKSRYVPSMLTACEEQPLAQTLP